MPRSMPRQAIEPFYFGPSSTPLFGCYHAPQTAPSRDCGVVLCSPMGEESVRCHRAYRQLASRLSMLGFPVLRFDFYGCGDSSGDCEQGQMRRWRTDISLAIDEIRRRGHSSKVGLVGLRLGGTLSMLVGAERNDIDSMVLWDPVVNGTAHVEELQALHQAMQQYAHVKPQHRHASEMLTEILGFPLTASMRVDLENIDLLAIQQKPAHHILVIESHAKVSQERLTKHLQRIDAKVEYRQLPDPRLWMWIEGISKVPVPHQILQAVAAWMSEGPA